MEITLHPNKELTTPTEPMLGIPEDETIATMFWLLRKKNGVGLAANQVGLKGRFFVADFSVGPVLCINPQILNHGKEVIEMLEGCLSLLDENGKFIYKPKKRWAVIDVVYHGPDHQPVQTTLKRNDARIFQHEVDHLEGRLCHDGKAAPTGDQTSRGSQ